MKVAILGGGISGLAAAVKFLELGHQVTVIEKKTIGSNIGGGIDIHPNGTKILLSMGIQDKFKELTAHNKREIRISNAEGKTLNVVSFHQLLKDQRYPLASLCRRDIIQMLFARTHGCQVYENSNCINVEVSEDKVQLILADNKTIEADVVIAADGIHSIARKLFFPESEKKYLGHLSLGGLVPAHIYRHNYIYGLQKTCVVFPCTQEVAHAVMFCPKPAGWLNENRNFDEQKKLFMGWSEEVDHILANLKPENRFCVESHEVQPLKSFVHKRLFLVGDAAHAMSPLGALATTLALEDVRDLADLFSSFQSIEEIGEKYDLKRISRAKLYREFSVQTLVPAITSHGPEDYKKRMDRFSSAPPEIIFEQLAKLTQDEV